MRRLAFCLAIGGIAALSMMFGTPAQAQATRTWVSGVGDDANPCSRTAPCKTFAGAISKTANGGEIDALDPGGFGALTITKSIIIDGGGGQVASSLVAGTNGFVISATATDVIIIKNMRFDGLLGGGNGNAGLAGIKFNSAKNLIIENCEIYGFNVAGIQITPGSGLSSPSVTIYHTQAYNNAVGLIVDGGGGAINVAVEDSVFSANVVVNGSSGNGVTVQTNSAHAGLTLDNSTVANNGGIGLQTNGSNAVAVIGRNLITANTTGVRTDGGNGTGTVQSFVNNEIAGNGTDITGTLGSAGGVK